MRIGFVTTEYITGTYFSGGLANYVYRVSKALVSLGHEVHVICLSDLNEGKRDHEGIQVHPLTTSQLEKWLNRLSRRRLRRTAHWVDFSCQAYFKIKELHAQSPFDILQFSNTRACGLVTSLLLGVPYVVRISCYRPIWNELSQEERNLDARVAEWLEWLQLRLSSHVYAPSHLLKKILEEQAGIHDVQVIRPPFFVESPQFETSIFDRYLNGKAYLLFFGRFQLHKGFHVLARALPKVLQAFPDLYVAMVGLDAATPVAPSMKEYALSLCGEHAQRLIFIDQTPHEKLYPIIAGAKLVVLPSLIDNVPNTCLEAMALGRPVIGTRGASFDEVITDGETGFLVPVGDPDALAAKIIEAMTHPNSEAIGVAARQRVQEFVPERTVRELVGYYDAVLNEKV
jgi:glycosyltransferase involved in cell wall biosynthesis